MESGSFALAKKKSRRSDARRKGRRCLLDGCLVEASTPKECRRKERRPSGPAAAAWLCVDARSSIAGAEAITSRLTGLQHTSPSPDFVVSGVCCFLSYPTLRSDTNVRGIETRIGRKTLQRTSLARPSSSSGLPIASRSLIYRYYSTACRQRDELSMVRSSLGRQWLQKLIRQGLAPTSPFPALRPPSPLKKMVLVRPTLITFHTRQNAHCRLQTHPLKREKAATKSPLATLGLCAFLRLLPSADRPANFGWLSPSTAATDCVLTAHFITSHYALCLTAALLPDGGAVIRGEFELGTPDLACLVCFSISRSPSPFFPASLLALSRVVLSLTLGTLSPFLSEANGYLLGPAFQVSRFSSQGETECPEANEQNGTVRSQTADFFHTPTVAFGVWFCLRPCPRSSPGPRERRFAVIPCFYASSNTLLHLCF